MAGRNVMILGLPNEGVQGYASFGTNGGVVSPTGMEPSYLGTEEPSDKARMSSTDSLYTQWLFSSNVVPREIDGLSIVNHNISTGGQIRFVASTVYGTLVQPTILTKAPSSIPASTNMTGSVGNVATAGDATSVGPTPTNQIWDVRFAWPTFSPDIPILGSSMACFAITCNLLYVGAGATSPVTVPRLHVELWENGVKKVDLGNRALPIATGAPTSQLFQFPFDFASLANPDGRDVECYCSFSVGTSASGSSYGTIDCCAIYYESQVVGAYGAYDSGWISTPGDTRPAPGRPTKSTHYIPATPWLNVTAAALMIRSDQTTHDPLVQSGIALKVPAGAASIPNNYIDVGVWCLGVGLLCSIGAKADLKYFTPTAQNLGQGQTIFGQTYAADEFRWRAGEPISLIVTRDELKVLQDQLGWRRGHSGAFYVALEPDVDISYQTFSSAWCTLVSMSAPQELAAYRADGQMLYTVTVQFQEKL